MLAVHANTGKLARIFDAPNHVTLDPRPLYVHGVVYVSNSRLWALEAETGKPLIRVADELLDNTGTPRLSIQFGIKFLL